MFYHVSVLVTHTNLQEFFPSLRSQSSGAPENEIISVFIDSGDVMFCTVTWFNTSGDEGKRWLSTWSSRDEVILSPYSREVTTRLSFTLLFDSCLPPTSEYLFYLLNQLQQWQSSLIFIPLHPTASCKINFLILYFYNNFMFFSKFVIPHENLII